MGIYASDILNGYEQTSIELKNDYEGKAIATLIRRLTPTLSDIAILYIHGFNDYFFQEEMGHQFNNTGYNFYALDLRKYGRSYLPHQKFNDIHNLKAYYEEINQALHIIRSENNKKVILMGHSTGGLIVTLYAKDNTSNAMFDGVILNSPFFEFNMSSTILEKLIPLASTIGKIFPNIQISGVLNPEYGESLHKDYQGEWDYNLEWKPNTPPPISLAWLRAIREGHKELKTTYKINEPILVMHSTATITDKFNYLQMHTMDAVLNVKHISSLAKNIKGEVQITAIEGGMHDLILSQREVREKVYQLMIEWIKQSV